MTESTSPVAADRPLSGRIGRYLAAAFLFWSATLAVMFAWDYSHLKQVTVDLSRAEVRVHYEWMQLFRSWVSSHGGVYVPVSDETPPNPFLDDPYRDIATPDGRPLTLMNPAYVTRQLFERYNDRLHVTGRLTSLTLTNPNNGPDPWEREALEAFERGEPERFEFVDGERGTSLRLIRPVLVEPACLNCHAHQGYAVGDIRGGLSLVAPVDRFFAAERDAALIDTVRYLFIWGLGVGALTLVGGGLKSSLEERERTEAALAQANALRARIMDSVSDVIFTLDLDGRFTFVNRRGAEVTGRSVDALIGLPFVEVLAPDRAAETWRLFETVRSGGRVGPAETELVRRDGVRRAISFSATPLMEEGRVVSVVGAAGDVTELRRTASDLAAARDQAEGATRLKDKFVSLVAHDLKSPLTAINGLVRLLVDEEDRDRRREATDGVLNSVAYMVKVIDELLNISRLQTGSIVVRPRFVDAHRVVAMTLASLGGAARLNGVRLANQVSPGHRLYVDPTLFGEALANLVSNAIKFTPDGGRVALTVAVMGEFAGVTVADTGVGVPEPFRAALLRHDEKTSAPGVRGERGTGLGLPYSNDIMAAHGGSIRFTSTVGEGSSFTLLTPLRRPTVMVVDDETPVRFLLGDYVRRLHASVVEAEDGERALALAGERRPDVIVTDMMMPRMDGIALLQALQADPRLREIPVIVVTADSGLETRQEAMSAGADDFLTKPVRFEEFSPRIRRYIG
jgi:PAS domain S-box-containing protein